MNKITSSLIALLFLALSAGAETKNYDLTNFNSLSVSRNFDVVLTKSDVYSVSVDLPSEYMPYLAVAKKAGVLVVSVDNMPNKLERLFNSKEDKFKLYVSMPELHFLALSGAVSLKGEGEFSCTMAEIEIKCSGATSIKNLSVTAPKVSIELSGASKVTMNVDARETEVESSGASKVTLSGTTTELDLDLSGASHIDTRTMIAKDVEIDASGASKIAVYADESLKVDMSGASKCEYVAPKPIVLDVEKISGASTFKRIDR